VYVCHGFLFRVRTVAKANNSIGPANGTKLSGGSDKNPADNSGVLTSGSNGGKMLPGIVVKTDGATVNSKSCMLVLGLGFGACGLLATPLG
jgi:hypothetical protein